MAPSPPNLPLIVSIIVLFILVEPAFALEDGRIGVLYIGCMARSTPIWWMRSDPLYSMNFVQATLRDWGGWGPTQVATSEGAVYRMVRLYMPRSVKDLTNRFDVVILANANRHAVSPRNVRMIADGVKSAEAVSLVMFGGWESFGGAFGNMPWGDSDVGELLPTEDAGNIYIHKPANSFKLVIDEPDHEFMRSLPWDPNQPFMSNYHHNLVTAKDGATVLAHVESFSFVDNPGFVEWELRENRARVWSITGEILGPSSEPGQIHTMCARGNPWEYTLDFGGNLMIYLDKRPVPQDLELVHKLRKTMFDATTRKDLLIGLLEFADSFGANTVGINNKLDELNTIVADVMPAYFELRFEEVLEAYEEIVIGLAQLEIEAIELKDRALLWVYIIEWLAVTGTAMMTGVLLWTVMVRRRLYREVGTTRMVASDS